MCFSRRDMKHVDRQMKFEGFENEVCRFNYLFTSEVLTYTFLRLQEGIAHFEWAALKTSDNASRQADCVTGTIDIDVYKGKEVEVCESEDEADPLEDGDFAEDDKLIEIQHCTRWALVSSRPLSFA